MATIEQERPTSSSPSPLDDISELSASVPTPFPVQTQSRGRTAAPSSSNNGIQQQIGGNKSSSRSPSATRPPSLGLLDKVKRAMSRDRTSIVGGVGGGSERSASRGRDSIDSSTTEEFRGRLAPLNPTTSRSTSQSRTGLIHSTGRGGAGNTFTRSPSRGRELLPVASESAEELSLELGEESIKTIKEAREKSETRSRSRGRIDNTVLVTSGRGGRGNVRSPSRDPSVIAENLKEVAYEKEVEENRKALGPSARGMSSGRGGRGNIIPVKSNGDALGGMAA